MNESPGRTQNIFSRSRGVESQWIYVQCRFPFVKSRMMFDLKRVKSRPLKVIFGKIMSLNLQGLIQTLTSLQSV